MAKKSSSGQGRTRDWGFIAYPSSLREDWIEVLSALGLQGAISPIHDKDTYQEDATDGSYHKGDPKKAHYHCLLTFEGVKTQEQVAQITQAIVKAGEKGYTPMKIHTKQGTLRYFLHLDDPKKAQYNINDVVAIGGFDFVKAMQTKDDEDYNACIGMGDVIKFINEQQCCDFAVLADLMIEQDKIDLFNIYRKNAYFFGQYLKTKKFFNKPLDNEK